MIECRLSLKWLYVDCLVSYKSLCWIGYRVEIWLPYRQSRACNCYWIEK